MRIIDALSPKLSRTRPCAPTNPPLPICSPQLALWKRYDEDGNGVLSRGELAHVVADYASARVEEIQKEELPKLRQMMEAEGSNQFLMLISRARMMAKEAELQLFKSQAEGQIAAADINDAFHKLDANHDVGAHTRSNPRPIPRPVTRALCLALQPERLGRGCCCTARLPRSVRSESHTLSRTLCVNASIIAPAGLYLEGRVSQGRH